MEEFGRYLSYHISDDSEWRYTQTILKTILKEIKYNQERTFTDLNSETLNGMKIQKARIFKFEDAYYLLEISGVLPSSRRDDALRYSVAKIIQNPELVYLDNPEKQKEIEKDIKDIYGKFVVACRRRGAFCKGIVSTPARRGPTFVCALMI